MEGKPLTIALGFAAGLLTGVFGTLIVVFSLAKEGDLDIPLEGNQGSSLSRVPPPAVSAENREVPRPPIRSQASETSGPAPGKNVVKPADAMPRELLFLAIKMGDNEEVRRLLDTGLDLRFPSQGQSALVEAIQSQKPGIVKLLLEKGAPVDQPDRWGKTPLMHAAGMNRKEILTRLLDRGARQEEAVKGWNALAFAVAHDAQDAADRLRAAGSTLTPHMEARTLLLGAAENGDTSLALQAFSSGASADTEDFWGERVLTVATRNDHVNMVRLLLDRGAKANTPSQSHTTPLYMAVYNDDRENHLVILKLLLDAGADPSIYGAPFSPDEPPLYQAVRAQDLKAVQMLLHHNAKAEQPNEQGTPVLHFACLENKLPILKIFLKRGVNPNLKDSEGYTPLGRLGKSGPKELLALLKAYGGE